MSGDWTATTPSHKGIDPNREIIAKINESDRLQDLERRSIIRDDVRDVISPINTQPYLLITDIALLIMSENSDPRGEYYDPDYWDNINNQRDQYWDTWEDGEPEPWNQDEYLGWYNDVNQ